MESSLSIWGGGGAVRGWVGLIHGHLPISHRSHLVLHRGLRATTSVHANFLSILQEKTYFFYFTHSLLQNTHISLSILHIYSIKYLFFLHFFIISFPLLLSGTLSQTQHKPKITHTHQPTHPPTHPPPSTHNHQPPSPHRKSKQKFQTPQKIQIVNPNPTKNQDT